ncbi:MAG: hypothetical protein WAL45_13135 [Terracidiphilus sp.]
MASREREFVRCCISVPQSFCADLFADEAGTSMLDGGGTILHQANIAWNAPGGGTVYIDVSGGESLFIFHAQNPDVGGAPFQ